MDNIDLEKVKQQAVDEFEKEKFREKVEAYKSKLKAGKSFLSRLFPYRITITKKGE